MSAAATARSACSSSLALVASILVVGVPTVAHAEADAELPRLALRESIDRAFAKNPTVVSASADIARSEALMRQARAGSYPTLVGNVVATRLDDDRTSAGRVLLAKEQLSANAALTVPLFAPTRWKAWSRAEDGVLIAQASAAEIRQRLAVAVARAYLAVIAQKRVREVRGLAKETADKHLGFARARESGGVGSKLELARVEQEVAVAETQIAQADLGVLRSREALGLLVGDDGPVDARDLDLPSDVPALPVAMEEAPRRRADLLALQTRVVAAERAKGHDWSEYAPTLAAIAQPFYQAPPTFTQPRFGWQAQLVLSVPIYDGGVRNGLHAERDAVAAATKAAYEGAVRQAKSETRAAGSSIGHADQALVSANRSAKLAKAALALVTAGFEGGTLTSLDVIDAERRARDADVEVVIAEDAARQARIDLLVASGRLP